MKNKCSLTLIELLIVLCIIFVFLGVFAIYTKTTLRIAREQALQNELTNIRMSIMHYQIIKGKLPEDLYHLINQSFTLKDADGKIVSNNFLKPFRVDKEGNLLDPFMSAYYYDKKKGKVLSQTEGYQNW